MNISFLVTEGREINDTNATASDSPRIILRTNTFEQCLANQIEKIIISRPPNAVEGREKMGAGGVVCDESRHVFEGGDKNVVIIRGILVNSV